MQSTLKLEFVGARVEPDPAATEPPLAFRDVWSRLVEVLDEETLLRLCALDRQDRPGSAMRALSSFERSSRRWIRHLQVAAGGDGTVRVGDVLHTFRSAAAIVGALELSRRCTEAERLAQERRTAELDAAVDAVVAEGRRVLTALGPLLPG